MKKKTIKETQDVKLDAKNLELKKEDLHLKENEIKYLRQHYLLSSNHPLKFIVSKKTTKNSTMSVYAFFIVLYLLLISSVEVLRSH